jgi:Mn2+/Fe2+ NRAMP family transporter
MGIAISAAYAISALQSGADWGRAAVSLVIPHGTLTSAYWLAVVGTVGTTITPWGQGFIQAYVADKRLGPDDLVGERIDVGLGSFLTNLIAAFIVIACAATLWAHGDTGITDAATAAKALAPFAGSLASLLFAAGLLGASLLGLGVVPLSSAYTACEAFGWETGVGWRWSEARAFYGLLAFFIGFAALFILIPGISLFQVMFLSQVLNGLLLPIILVFVMLLSSDRRLLGPLASGRFLLGVGWVITVALTLMSLLLVWTSLFPIG